jgi:pimeloyl-ACP methyl ester carboxylesterase
MAEQALLLGLLAVPFGVVAFYSIAAYMGSRPAIGGHPEWRHLIAAPEDHDLHADVVEFPSRDGIGLKAWWLPATEQGRAAVVLAHGMSGNRSYMLGRAGFLARHGFDALAIDLRGHGESSGNYMTPGYLEALDVLGAVDYLRERRDRQRIVLLGYSYGAVAVLHAAAESRDVSAVIADAGFISYSDMMDRARNVVLADKESSFGAKIGMSMMSLPFIMPAARLAFRVRTGVDVPPEKADAIASIPSISQPVLFIAGADDPIAPAMGAQSMFEQVSNPRKGLVILPGADHETYASRPSEYEAAVLGFLDSVLS